MKFKQNKFLLFTLIIIIASMAVLLFGCSNNTFNNENSSAKSENLLVDENSTDYINGTDESLADEFPENPTTSTENENAAPANQENENSTDGLYEKENTQTNTFVENTTPEEASFSDSENENNSNLELSCTISVACHTVLDNMEKLDPDKAELIPADGWILKPLTVTFYEGESVFNVLSRTLKENKIHMEFETAPIYNSAYIEGIGNLYEFDCGDLSGWMYKVNGWFPNYGCSLYEINDNDTIEWVYTCDLGHDIGGSNAAEN